MYFCSEGLIVLTVACIIKAHTLALGYHYPTPTNYEFSYPAAHYTFTTETPAPEPLLCPPPPPPEIQIKIEEKRVPFIPEEHIRRDEAMKAKIKEQEAEIEDKGVKLNDREKELQDHKELIAEKEETIKLLLSDAGGKDRIIAKQKDELMDEAEIIRELKDELGKKDRVITKQENDLESCKERARVQQREIDNKDRIITKQKDDLDDQEKVIRKQKGDIENRDRFIVRLENALKDRDDNIRKLQGDLNNRERLIDRQKKDIDNGNRIIQTQTEKIRILELELRKLRRQSSLGIALGNKVIEFVQKEEEEIKKEIPNEDVIRRKTQETTYTTSSGEINDRDYSPGSRVAATGGSGTGGFSSSRTSSFEYSSAGGSSGGGGTRIGNDSDEIRGGTFNRNRVGDRGDNRGSSINDDDDFFLRNRGDSDRAARLQDGRDDEKQDKSSEGKRREESDKRKPDRGESDNENPDRVSDERKRPKEKTRRDFEPEDNFEPALKDKPESSIDPDVENFDVPKRRRGDSGRNEDRKNRDNEEIPSNEPSGDRNSRGRRRGRNDQSDVESVNPESISDDEKGYNNVGGVSFAGTSEIEPTI